MFIRTTRPVRYHGWTLETGTVLNATVDPSFGVIPSSGWTAPHPRVEGAFINVPAGHAVETTCPTCGDTADWCPEVRA